MRSKIKAMNGESNLRIIEWLKAELIESTSVLFKSLLRSGGEATADALSTIVIICYVLGRRVGINYQSIDMNIMHKINTTVNEASEIEQMYGDLTELKKYLDRKESRTR
ncbi:MAG TPA: MazG-like family protein [Syntrophomonas sp.]|nr:MazG-like family protein [Syntrophomonas sp.]HRW11939.1 MazG-like family protein [Syntrophomonas sp.]